MEKKNMIWNLKIDDKYVRNEGEREKNWKKACKEIKKFWKIF